MAELSLEKITAVTGNLERVLDNLKDGIIAHDMNRKVFVFNRQAEVLTGLKREDVLGRDCHDIFGIPLCGDNCHFCGGPSVDQNSLNYPINVMTRTGDHRRVDMTVTPMLDKDGAVIGVVAALRDMTDYLDLCMRADKLTSFSNIIGQDSQMCQIYKQIRDVSSFEYPVHIFGETGTGKELVAAAIHNESDRSNSPFVPINCGALPEGLIESELFGHVKGSFSGAIRDKKGRFELADGGTIFLDEVAELSKYMQVKLLRFLQEGTFERVGGEKTHRVNVRIISATNKDLKKEIEKDTFREDLYYRLNVVPILLPPLRRRKTDIPLLVDHFLKQAAERYPGTALKVSHSAMSVIMDYGWPGNVRELQNCVQFAIVKSGGAVIQPDDLPMELRREVENIIRKGPNKKLDVAAVRQALSKTAGNKVKAAKLLGVGRATLYRFLKDYPDGLDDLAS